MVPPLPVHPPDPGSPTLGQLWLPLWPGQHGLTDMHATEGKTETLPEQHSGIIHRYTAPLHHQLSQVMPMSPTFNMKFCAFSPPPNRG